MTSADTVTPVISPTELFPPARGESDVTCSVATTLVGDGENSVGLDVGEGGDVLAVNTSVEHIHRERRTMMRDHAGMLSYIAYCVSYIIPYPYPLYIMAYCA